MQIKVKKKGATTPTSRRYVTVCDTDVVIKLRCAGGRGRAPGARLESIQMFFIQTWKQHRATGALFGPWSGAGVRAERLLRPPELWEDLSPHVQEPGWTAQCWRCWTHMDVTFTLGDTGTSEGKIGLNPPLSLLFWPSYWKAHWRLLSCCSLVAVWEHSAE